MKDFLMPSSWSDVEKTWLQEYQWLIDAKYPNGILTFITYYEYLLAKSKTLCGRRRAFNDPKSLQLGFKNLINTKPLTPDLNKNIYDLCYKLIQTCPQPDQTTSGITYYDEIKKQLEKNYPNSLSIFPSHEHNSLNNPPKETDEQRKEYTHALADLFGWSWSISQKPESLINIQNKEDYFKFYFTVLIHSRNWLYHNNKAGNVEVDKFVIKKHLDIMKLMIKNWK